LLLKFQICRQNEQFRHFRGLKILHFPKPVNGYESLRKVVYHPRKLIKQFFAKPNGHPIRKFTLIDEEKKCHIPY